MTAEVSNKPLAPFLKWAGGKRWFASRYSNNFFNIKFNRFVEPFLGSGAIFFHLAPKLALLSDKNEQLIETYCAVRDDWQKVHWHLQRHHKSHCESYYYSIRQSHPRSSAGRAAQFIYLNRTCWNGLYRVNMKGEFNVPIGTKTNVLLDTDDFESTSRLLDDCTIVSCDFEETLSKCKKGDFVFVDPPYTVKHNTNGFIKYNEGIFSWDDQIRLRDCVVKARDRGASVLVTNANHSSVKALYTGVGELLITSRSSVISGTASTRGQFEEMVVKCY